MNQPDSLPSPVEKGQEVADRVEYGSPNVFAYVGLGLCTLSALSAGDKFWGPAVLGGCLGMGAFMYSAAHYAVEVLRRANTVKPQPVESDEGSGKG